MADNLSNNSSSDEEYVPPTKRKRLNKKEEDESEHETPDSENDEEDEDESDDDPEYFEKDTEKIRETIIQHVGDLLKPAQRKALLPTVRKGVTKAVELLDEMVAEHWDPLVEEKPTMNLWKLGLGPKNIKKYNALIKDLRKRDKPVTIQQILDAPLNRELKRKLLSLFDMLQTHSPYSEEYQEITKEIKAILTVAEKRDKFNVDNLQKIIGCEKSLIDRILEAQLDDKRKAVIYEKFLQLQKTPSDSTSAASIEEWIEEALKTPFTKVQPSALNTNTPGECLLKLKQGFQSRLAEMDTILEPLLTIFNNRLNNPSAKGAVIGLLGSPGTGKTAVCQVIADVWGLPFQQISLGGVIDPSILDGSHNEWVGSTPGRLTRALQAMGVINGVILLDEIDKLGESERGLQVQYSLLHSIDPVQNHEFHDHYLGPRLPLDLSQCLFVCAMNRLEGLDPALLNRIHIIKIPDYTTGQKISILRKHLFPDALKQVNFTEKDIILTEEGCEAIIKSVEKHMGHKEGGVRTVKSCIKIIVDKLSLLLRVTPEERRALKLTFNVAVDQRPVRIDEAVVAELYKTGNESDAPWRNMYI